MCRLDQNTVTMALRRVFYSLSLSTLSHACITAKKRRKSYFDFTSDLPLSYMYQSVVHSGTDMTGADHL